jgi:hypothetical protein
MTNTLDFVAWWRRGSDKVVVAAKCTSSSSLLGCLCSGLNKTAVGVEEVSASATATAKFILDKHIIITT